MTDNKENKSDKSGMWMYKKFKVSNEAVERHTDTVKRGYEIGKKLFPKAKTNFVVSSADKDKSKTNKPKI